MRTTACIFFFFLIMPILINRRRTRVTVAVTMKRVTVTMNRLQKTGYNEHSKKECPIKGSKMPITVLSAYLLQLDDLFKVSAHYRPPNICLLQWLLC